MKLHQKLFLVMCCIFVFSLNSIAQPYPIQVQVIVPQPVPTNRTQALSLVNQPVLILTNTSFKKLEVMLGGSITNSIGLSATFNPNDSRPSSPLILNPTETKVMTVQNLSNVFAGINTDAINFSGTSLQQLIQNPIFPEGKYEVCVEVFDYNSGNQLSAPAPINCAPPVLIQTPDPPIWINPLNNSTVRLFNNFMPVNFQWTPVNLKGQATMIQYDVRIVSLIDESVNPYEAIDNDKFLWWEEKGLSAPIFVYDALKPILKNGQYAARVTAYDPAGIIPIKNKGQSDIVIFNVKREKLEPPIVKSPTGNIDFLYPQNYLLSWIDQAALNAPINYKVEVAEVPKGLAPIDAFSNPSTLLLQETTGDKTLLYDTKFPKLGESIQYAIRVQAFDPLGELEFKNDGWSAIETFSIQPNRLLPPEITSPIDNENLTGLPHLFKWEHKDGSPTVEYTLSIWELRAGETEAKAMRRQAVVVKTQLGELKTSLDFNNSNLVPNKSYIARVIANDTEGRLFFGNNGRSEFIKFNIQRTETNIEALDCGEGCEVAEQTDRTPVSIFRQGSILRIGNVGIELGEIDKEGTRYSGEATITEGNFFDAPVKIDLVNVEFNGDGWAISGHAIATTRRPSAFPTSWMRGTGNLTAPSNPAQAYQHFDDFYATGSNGNQAQELPIKFGNVAITYLKLTPTGAITNLVSIKELSGDVNDNQKYLVFGKKGVCFSAGGLAVNGNQAKLPLLTDVTVNEGDNYKVTIQKNVTGAPNDGTVLPIDCNGGSEVEAVGYITFTDASLRRINSNSNNPPKFYAQFATNFLDYNNWETPVNFIPYGQRTTFAASSTPITFELDQLHHFDFEASTATFDHSLYSNLESMPDNAFADIPEIGQGTSSNSNIGTLARSNVLVRTFWKGLYFTDMMVKTPAFLTDNNDQKIEMPFAEVVLGADGISGTLEKHYNYGQRLRGKIEDWEAEFYRFELDIQASELLEGTYIGRVYLPIFKENDWVGFTADMAWSNNRTNHQLTFRDFGNRDYPIDMWSAEATLLPNSYVASVVDDRNEKLYLTANLSGTLDFDSQIGEIYNCDVRDIGFTNLILHNTTTFLGYPLDPMTVGGFSIPQRNQKIGGYFANITNIDFINNSSNNKNLNFHYTFQFDGASYGLVGETDFAINSKKESGVWSQEAATVNRFNLDQTIPGVIDVNGYVQFTNTPNSADFTGDIQGKFLTMGLQGTQVGVYARLGRKNNRKYWAIVANATLGQFNRIPAGLPGLYIKGFGGGAYYNMNETAANNNPNALQDFNFVPKMSGGSKFGLLANVVLETESADFFNGRFRMDLSFESGGLNQIRLRGQANFMQDNYSTSYWLNNTAPPNSAKVKLNGDILLDWPNKIFHAELGYDINISDLTGRNDRAVALHFDRRDWYLHIGTATTPIGLKYAPKIRIIGKNISLGEVTLQSYFQIGSDIGGVLFGTRADYRKTIRLGEFWDDTYKVKLHLWAGVRGGFGKNLNECSNQRPNEWFGFFEAGMGASGHLWRYDPCDWPLERDCGGWSRYGGSVSLDLGKFYLPNPTGYRGTLDLIIIERSFTIGQSCN